MDQNRLVGLSWSELRRRAEIYARERQESAFGLATHWYTSADWEIRYFAVSVLGRLASSDPRALQFLFDRCGGDPAWQVNEALAMAFDDYCAGVGYEEALPIMWQWLNAPSPNLRRAVSEGLRPWTASRRAYFARNPSEAIALLGTLKDDESRYVQESVGNALRDISRKSFPLVLETLKTWIAEKPDSPSRKIVARFALRNAAKDDPSLTELWTGKRQP